MEHAWVILGMAAGVYALRFAGLAFSGLHIPVAWERGVRLVPVALLAALFVTGLAPKGAATADLPLRAAAAGVAALVARRAGQMWACILSGLALYYLLRAAVL